MSRLRFSVSLAPTQSEITAPEESFVTFAPMEAIMNGLGGLDTSRVARLSDLKDGSYNYFSEGDVLLAKVTPCFENGKKAYAQNLENGIGYATSEVFVIRPDLNKIDPNFLLYLMSSEDFRSHGVRSMTGAGGLKRVSPEAILNFRTTINELEKQRDIATYLDRETARIDGLIEKKTRFIALLKEKRVAVIAHAVTKGLNRNAPVKDSGQGWLGEVPAHWEVCRIATLFREAERDGDAAAPVLSVSIHDGITDGELTNEERDRRVALSEDRSKYQGVEPGDLAYNMMRAWQGAFGAVAVKGLVSPAYVVAAPIRTFRTKFIEHLLHTNSAAEEIRRYSKGIADFRMRLYWEYFRNIRVCLPPLEEQDAILAAIDTEIRKIESLVTATEKSIALLKEKRTALITAAVTGKIDVRSAA